MKIENVLDVRVYWDSQDPANESWAYRVVTVDGRETSDAVDGVPSDDLDGAIDEACRLLDLDLGADAFAREPNLEGGFAIFTRDAAV
jgi:hypothetical protein